MTNALPALKRTPVRGPLVAALLALLTLSLVGCRIPRLSRGDIRVSITADGETRQIDLPAGSTVAEALQAAGIEYGGLDRSEPPFYAVLSDGDHIRLIRVREAFETQNEVIPFERRVVRNESLPEGESRLIQMGVNGLQELTYRIVYEDGEEVSNTIVKTTVLQTPVPEIVMVGVRASFAPLSISGRLAYLAGGNAWIMEESTSNRRPLVTTGDLDGRVFALSPNGDWLLYTRKSDAPPEEEINTLWVVSTIDKTPRPIRLKVSNVVHFAGWVPGRANTVAYSTVEPRANAPGWQANNDLYMVTFGGSGWVGTHREVIEANSGGVYGWWGTIFVWSPDGHLAYARPDEIGLVDVDKGYFKPFMAITPLQTHSDWAWIPGLTWGADSRTLYVVTHAPPTGLINPEESPFFDLSAISLVNGTLVTLVPQTGMFAYPSASPLRTSGNEKAYHIAYLQAIFPAQSETSHYRLAVMDRDGSNRRVLFPPEDAPGMEPQTPVWAPEPLPEQEGDFVAVIYQGNLWLVDTLSAQAYQVTGDGLITRIDWK